MSEMSNDKKDEQRGRMLAALAEGLTWEEASDRVGVSARTLRRWCEADPELARQAAKAKDGADDLVEAVTFTNCLDPDPAHNTLRMFWLKSRRPEVYREKVDQQYSGRIEIHYVNDWRTPVTGEDPPACPP